VPPTVTLLTAAGPYAEMIDLGQRRMSPEIMNVSAMGGFAFADAPECGLSVVVTARRDKQAAERLAREIAKLGWANRSRFYPRLTTLDEAVAKALLVGRDRSLPPLAFADVADNPGGGGRGNTTFLLRAFYEARVEGALLGVFYDPDLAAEAHRQGVGARFEARFNRCETTNFSEPYSAPATVVALTDGRCVGRRGIYAGLRLELGPCAALQVGGITVVVISHRVQCADPAFFEMMGLDIGRARSVVVKSRGHFRGGFDEFFSPGQIVEVDLPGLTSPMLDRFAWTRLPRPVIPLDAGVDWRPPSGDTAHA
jgi:microcystin degradation protein MlrC